MGNAQDHRLDLTKIRLVPKGPASRNCVVLHLISSLKVGGAERLLIDFVKSCNEAPQIQTVVVVMNNSVDQKLAAELAATAGVATYYFDRPEGSRDPSYIFDLLKILRRHKIQVIHSHDPGSKYWSALCRILWIRLKLVYTMHDTRIPMSRSEIAFHNCIVDSTIAISRAVAEESRSRKIKRVQHVDNGVPISQFRSVSPRPLASVARVITVGRFLPVKKGQDVLMRAIKRCVDDGLDVECTFVGNQDPRDMDALPRLEALAANLQLSDRVRFVQDRTDVATLLGDANIFVLPSRWEGFGIVLIEAMAAGLPVIASNVDGPANIISDGTDGLLFEAGSDEQLAEKIATLIQFPGLADKLGRAGRATSCTYDIATTRDKYMAVYRNLITSGRPASGPAD